MDEVQLTCVPNVRALEAEPTGEPFAALYEGVPQ